jgi:hypothetical protein
MNGGEIAFLVVVLLFLLWQLVEAVWRGRIYDLVFDDDFLYFFDHPILFSLEAAGYAVVAYYIVRYALKRKPRRGKK